MMAEFSVTVNLTSTEDHDETFRNQRNFLTVSKSCLTIFRQLSDNESKSKRALLGLEPTSVRVTTKAVNREDKRSHRYRDRHFAKFERSRCYRDRYRC